MGPKTWVLFAVCCLIGPGISSAGSFEQGAPILIKLDGMAHLPELDQARSIVAGIYRAAGVDLQFGEHTASVSSNRTLTIVLTTRKAAPAGVRRDATGVAPTPGDGSRGTVAYIFLDAIVEFAGAHRVPLAYVLGCAIAHEIGHLLLPPNAHEAGGIMRGQWHPADFPPVSPGVLGFTAEQARLLRIRAESR